MFVVVVVCLLLFFLFFFITVFSFFFFLVSGTAGHNSGYPIYFRIFTFGSPGVIT